jgi:hypothetical protein
MITKIQTYIHASSFFGHFICFFHRCRTAARLGAANRKKARDKEIKRANKANKKVLSQMVDSLVFTIKSRKASLSDKQVKNIHACLL